MKSCSLHPKSTAEAMIPDFWGKVRKIHAASTLDFWNASFQDFPFGNSSDMQGNAQVMWSGHNNSGWTQLLSRLRLDTRCVREEASRIFQPLHCWSLASWVPRHHGAESSRPCWALSKVHWNPEHDKTAVVHTAKFGKLYNSISKTL